ncbi:MAG: chloramphenicol resistance protein [Oscillospiraceae bacterium]|nr:chloramphenicol resistance protein [Oscillospiraceae bacterium]
MSIVSSVRNYILDFPELKDGRLQVDFLDTKAVEYTVETVPVNPIIKKYVDGGTLKQYNFIFASREFFGTDVNQNIENLNFYEQFSEWIETQNKNQVFPELETGKEAQSIEILTSGYVFEMDSDNARYQIQCRMLYEED